MPGFTGLRHVGALAITDRSATNLRNHSLQRHRARYPDGRQGFRYGPPSQARHQFTTLRRDVNTDFAVPLTEVNLFALPAAD